MLKLNNTKTEMLVIISKFRQYFHCRNIFISEFIMRPGSESIFKTENSYPILGAT